MADLYRRNDTTRYDQQCFLTSSSLKFVFFCVLVVALVIGCIYWYWSSHLVVLHPLISIFLYAYLDCKN